MDITPLTPQEEAEFLQFVQAPRPSRKSEYDAAKGPIENRLSELEAKLSTLGEDAPEREGIEQEIRALQEKLLNLVVRCDAPGSNIFWPGNEAK